MCVRVCVCVRDIYIQRESVRVCQRERERECVPERGGETEKEKYVIKKERFDRHEERMKDENRQR